MKAFEENKKVWDDIYSGGLDLEIPHTDLVRFTNYLFKDKNKKLLDLGFGTGNNLIYFLRKGFVSYGCEVSSAAIESTKEKLKKQGISAELKLVEDRLPYPDKFFDIVVSWQVLYYNDEKSLKFMLKEIKRILKDDGKIMVTLVRKNSTLSACADKIGEKEYRINSSLPSQEGAILYIPDTIEDIKNVFNIFNNVKIGYFESDFLGRCISEWVIYGEKK